MVEETDFSRLESQYEINLSIQMETPLRIGATDMAAQYSISSAPVLLSYDAGNKNYVPFIPGSSLKGVMRAAAERILKTNLYDGDWGKTEKKAVSIVENLFGSMKARSKVTVRDFYPEGGEIWQVKDRPHVNPRKGRNGKMRPNFRTEEVIEPLKFTGTIRVDNPTEGELQLLNWVINEFEYRRLQIGGASSRGNGFASPTIDRVIKKSLDGIKIIEEVVELPKVQPVRNYEPLDCKDFDAYATSENRGAVVYEFSVECLSDFRVPGVGEDTVTMNDLPVIPGSTIKGFLRKEMNTRWNREEVKEVFGSTQMGGDASRMVVSDAFFWELPSNIPRDYLPAGSELTGWIFFHNMKFSQIDDIVQLLSRENRITGKTSARMKPNKVRFSVDRKWHYLPNDPYPEGTV